MKALPVDRLKVLLFVFCSLPLGRLLWAAYTGDFGANPVEFVQRWTGTWTVNFLVLTLFITPLRKMTNWNLLIRFRRMLGLFTFFYACLHLLAFVGFDHDFEIDALARDVLKRPFVTVGFAAWAVMLPLALTSNAFTIRRLGGQRWQSLHRNIYLIAILACVHYFWLVKATALLWPIGYSLIIAYLLFWRVQERLRRSTTPVRPKGAQVVNFFERRPPPPGRNG